jgi:CRP-like cAMP-binding protein
VALDLPEVASSLGAISHDRVLARGSTIYRQSEVPPATFTVQRGWAALVHLTHEGDRQILDFALPGDVIGYHGLPDAPANHGAECLSELQACVFPVEQMRAIQMHRPDIGIRLTDLAARAERRAQSHRLNVGVARSGQRIGFLLLTLFLRAAGRPPSLAGETLQLPIHLRLADLAEATAMTPVHVSRVLKQLRADGIVDVRGTVITVGRGGGLAKLADVEVDPLAW